MDGDNSRPPIDLDENFDLDIRKKGGGVGPLLWVLGGGIALVLLFCVVAGGVGLFVGFMNRDSRPDQFVGAWRGQFVLRGQVLDTIYTFNKDGSLQEDSFDLQGRRIQGGIGRWRVRNGEVEIDWNQGGLEIATAKFVNANTMEYRIIQHTDAAQIGMGTTFRKK